jgi:hypothetical protein
MIRVLAGFTFVAALSLCSAVQACEIGGRITGAGLPIGGVDVVEMLLGAAPQSLGLTAADGTFTSSVEPLPADQQALKVVLRKAPFEDYTLLFSKDPASGCPTPPRRDADLGRLDAETNNGASSPSIPDLCAQPSVGGLTIFLAPYEIYGNAERNLAMSLNGDLPQIVYHRIRAFKSRLGGLRMEDISVVPICVPLSAAQGEQIRSVGAALNALAVIAGDGELRTVDGGQSVIDLESVFRVVPVWQDFGGSALQIGDTIPAARLRPSRVAEGLTDLWGKQAVLAVALRHLAEPHEPATEQEVKQMLIELRKTMQMDDPLLSDVQSLLARLEAGDRQ